MITRRGKLVELVTRRFACGSVHRSARMVFDDVGDVIFWVSEAEFDALDKVKGKKFTITIAVEEGG